MTEIIVLPPKEQALEVFSTPKGMDPYIAKIRAEIDTFVPDVSTKKGRDAIASIAYKVAKSKTAIDNVRKDVVSDLKELPKKVDAEGKRVRDLLDAWRDEVRKPLTDWEDAEIARIKKHKDGLAFLNGAYDAAINSRLFTLDDLKERYNAVKKTAIDESWQEFLSEACAAYNKAIDALADAITSKEVAEAKEAELQRLQAAEFQRQEKEREEKRIQEAVENAKLLAEATAKRQADQAALRELQLKAELEQAERRAAELVQAEKDRQAKEIADKEAESMKRFLDDQNRIKISESAFKAFSDGGMPDAYARMAVNLIAEGKVPNVKIIY